MKRRAVIAGALMGFAGIAWLLRQRSASPVPGPRLTAAELGARYATPLPPPAGPMEVYHLGHSLVGRDMPAMLAQMAGHLHHSQLGWGASLGQHRSGEVPGFGAENAHPAHRPAQVALHSGTYDAVILTEMVELRDAIRWHDSARHLAHWARVAQAGNPAVRVYLYETWHRLDDADGWLNRLDRDLADLWQGQLLAGAMAEPATPTVHLIPGGQVMAAATRAIEAGQVPGLTSRTDLFAPGDPIHFSDLGAWLMALTHYAVLYHRPPMGLPHRLARADGTPATSPPDSAVTPLQEVVWRTVTRYPATGLAQAV